MNVLRCTSTSGPCLLRSSYITYTRWTRRKKGQALAGSFSFSALHWRSTAFTNDVHAKLEGPQLQS